MAMYDRAPRRIPDSLQTLLNAVAEATGTDFNFVLMNFYQDGTHSISYHSDDEKFLGTTTSSVSCAVLSLVYSLVPVAMLLSSMRNCMSMPMLLITEISLFSASPSDHS